MAFTLCSCGRSADSEPAAVQPSEVTTAADTAAVTIAPQSEPTTTTTAESETTTPENTTTAETTTTSDSKTTTTAEKKTTTAKQTAAPKNTTAAKQTAAGFEYWNVRAEDDAYWALTDAQKKEYQRMFIEEFGYWEEPYKPPTFDRPLTEKEYYALDYLEERPAYEEWFKSKYGYYPDYSSHTRVIEISDDEYNKLMNEFAQEELKLVNEERAKVGAAPLKLDTKLQAAAKVRAQEANEFFSHTRPDGRDCTSIADDMDLSPFKLFGENLVEASFTPQNAVEAWLNSPRHKAAMLSPEFTYVGLGVCIAKVEIYTELIHGQPVVEETYYGYGAAVQLFAT